MVFYSLEELNKELWGKVREENRIPFSGRDYSRFELFIKEEKEALQPLPQSKFEYLERKIVKVAQDFSYSFDKVHYSMPRKYLRKQLEVLASDDLLYVYNLNGDLVRTHRRSHILKDWVVIPEDIPKEYAPDEWGRQLSEQSNCFGKLGGIRRKLTDGFTVYIEKT